MKVLLVTSQITFVPNNDQVLFDELLEKTNSHIAGLVLIQNFSFDLIFKTVWLYSMGCTNFATTLVKNIVALPFQKREKLFKKRGLPVFQIRNMNDFKMISWIKKNKVYFIFQNDKLD